MSRDLMMTMTMHVGEEERFTADAFESVLNGWVPLRIGDHEQRVFIKDARVSDDGQSVLLILVLDPLGPLGPLVSIAER